MQLPSLGQRSREARLSSLHADAVVREAEQFDALLAEAQGIEDGRPDR
ncbi:hypothetical protein [Actinophytocola sp. KF-1]